jgi:hypothetical protein
MIDRLEVRHGIRIALCLADGPMITSERDAVDMIGDTYGQDVEVVVIPVERLGTEFFDLSTRVAGEILQKFVNYHLRVAIIGDLSEHLTTSSALRAFVYESNRGKHLWFVEDMDDLDARLRQEAQSAAERGTH